MNNFYLKVPSLDTKYYTDYFLNEHIPKYKILERIENNEDNSNRYLRDYLKDRKYTAITDLENLLFKKYNIFFKVEYFSIFCHKTFDQRIHIDGYKNYRFSSFNLPLIGYENTKMIFYQLKNSCKNYKNVEDAFYFDENDVEPINEVEGSNEWILVNSSVPHRIVSTVDNSTPRITVCIRFRNNPKFETLSKFFKKN